LLVCRLVAACAGGPSLSFTSLHLFSFSCPPAPHALLSFPTRRSSDLRLAGPTEAVGAASRAGPLRCRSARGTYSTPYGSRTHLRSEEHTSELQSRRDLVCRLLLEKKKKPKLVRGRISDPRRPTSTKRR